MGEAGGPVRAACSAGAAVVGPAPRARAWSVWPAMLAGSTQGSPGPGRLRALVVRRGPARAGPGVFEKAGAPTSCAIWVLAV